MDSERETKEQLGVMEKHFSFLQRMCHLQYTRRMNKKYILPSGIIYFPLNVFCHFPERVIKFNVEI